MQAMSGRFEMRLDEETLREVDGWRSAQTDVPSRSEAIRRLIDRGLRNPEDQPRMTGTEMLIVHMLCDLLKSSKAKTEINLKFLQEALYGGHFWALRWDLTGIFHTHSDSPEVVKEVVDVLDMWDFIEGSYEKLDSQQKAQLEGDVEIFGKDPKFSGFDGNNEAEHMGVARFLIDDMRRFSRFKGRELNSHMPTSRESYRRMLDVFLPMRTTLHGGQMSGSQLAAVLSERTHPSRRKS
jgi:uncharacterized protein